MAIVTHLTVSNTPIIQNLEQHIENVAMGLFHFIKQHHGIWTTAHLQEMSEVCVKVLSVAGSEQQQQGEWSSRSNTSRWKDRTVEQRQVQMAPQRQNNNNRFRWCKNSCIAPAAKAHRLCQLPSLIVANVARWRANQPTHAVLFHVLYVCRNKHGCGSFIGGEGGGKRVLCVHMHEVGSAHHSCRAGSVVKQW
jgi:hypothetical protein